MSHHKGDRWVEITGGQMPVDRVYIEDDTAWAAIQQRAMVGLNARAQPTAGRPQPAKTKNRAPIHLSDGEVTAIMGRMLQLVHRGKTTREEKEELKRLRKDINLIHKKLVKYHELIDNLIAIWDVETAGMSADPGPFHEAYYALKEYRQS